MRASPCPSRGNLQWLRRGTPLAGSGRQTDTHHQDSGWTRSEPPPLLPDWTVSRPVEPQIPLQQRDLRTRLQGRRTGWDSGCRNEGEKLPRISAQGPSSSKAASEPLLQGTPGVPSWSLQPAGQLRGRLPWESGQLQGGKQGRGLGASHPRTGERRGSGAGVPLIAGGY